MQSWVSSFQRVLSVDLSVSASEEFYLSKMFDFLRKCFDWSKRSCAMSRKTYVSLSEAFNRQ